jgi:hypothetical protein
VHVSVGGKSLEQAPRRPWRVRAPASMAEGEGGHGKENKEGGNDGGLTTNVLAWSPESGENRGWRIRRRSTATVAEGALRFGGYRAL